MLRKHFMLIPLLLPISAYAAGPSYSYAELNYIADQQLEAGGADDDGDGFNFNASFAVNETLFVNGGYSDSSLDDTGIDLSTLSLGAGARTSLSDTLDAFGVFSYEKFEVEVTGASEDEDGYGLAGGLRGLLSPEFELNGQVKYTDLDESDGVGVKVGALYSFMPNWAVNADYGSGELEDDAGDDLDLQELRFGLRYIF